MSEAAVTSKGQITIPVGIRKSLRLQAQDRIVFTRRFDGIVVMRAKVLARLLAVDDARQSAQARALMQRAARTGAPSPNASTSGVPRQRVDCP